MRRLPLVLFVLAGCSPSSGSNDSGNVAAQRIGDLSHPLAERRAPAEEEAELCGDGAVLPGGTDVRRTPYVQRVTDTSARVLWTTGDEDPERVDLWQASPDAAALTVVRQAELQPMTDAAPAAGVTQVAGLMDTLTPDTIYCYQLAEGDDPAMAAAGFRTAPAPGSGARVTFAAFGDSGAGGDDQFSVLEQLATVPMRLMLHTGDIAYEEGTMQQFEDNFFAVYAPFIDSIPMFPSIGNHDDPVNYHQVYDMPWAASGRDYYSFDHGDVHFVALDTTLPTQAQADWLDEDLAANQLPWTVVYGHHPAFSSGEHGSSPEVQELFVPVFEKHGVDLVLAGHEHNYERIEPQNGVHYVVTGGGGRGTRPMGPPEDFTAFAESVLHFVYVEIEGDQLLLHAIDATGVEFDQLAITH